MARTPDPAAELLIECLLARVGMVLEDVSVFAIDQRSEKLSERLKQLELGLDTASKLQAAAAAFWTLSCSVEA
jgi:hypothetical protein